MLHSPCADGCTTVRLFRVHRRPLRWLDLLVSRYRCAVGAPCMTSPHRDRPEEVQMRQIDVRAQAQASPQQVWTVLADTASWADWAPFDEVVVELGHEVGEIRRLRSGRIRTRERIVGFEPP